MHNHQADTISPLRREAFVCVCFAVCRKAALVSLKFQLNLIYFSCSLSGIDGLGNRENAEIDILRLAILSYCSWWMESGSVDFSQFLIEYNWLSWVSCLEIGLDTKKKCPMTTYSINWMANNNKKRNSTQRWNNRAGWFHWHVHRYEYAAIAILDYLTHFRFIIYCIANFYFIFNFFFIECDHFVSATLVSIFFLFICPSITMELYHENIHAFMPPSSSTEFNVYTRNQFKQIKNTTHTKILHSHFSYLFRIFRNLRMCTKKCV